MTAARTRTSRRRKAAERPAMTLGELAEVVNGHVAGDGSVKIGGVASIADAEQGDIVFAENPRFLSEAIRSRASAVVAFLDAVSPDKPLIRVENPRFAFAQILDLFSPRVDAEPGVHPTAVIGEKAEIPESASIGPHVTIGKRVRIGERCRIMAGCRIGDNVVMGEECVLYPNVTLYPRTVLGARVVLHSGVVVGSDGFGYVRVGDRLHKVPHLGNVVIGDDVEVGANTTIDRAKTGSTIIGARTKIDNLVQVAHNVRIGEDCVIAAMVGIAGSAVLGRTVTVAGQVGIKDHVTIGDGAVLLGQAGVWGDVPPGTIVSGCPAVPHRERLRQEAAIARGPEIGRQVAQLLRENIDLRARLERLEALVLQLETERTGAAASDVPESDGKAA